MLRDWKFAPVKPWHGWAPDVRAICCTLALLAVGSSFTVATNLARAADGSEPYLDILAAEILEEPPIDSDDAAGRVIVLALELAGPPPSPCTAFDQQFGFLIDSDTDPATDASGGLFEGFGPDARIVVACDASTGNYVSPAGFAISVSGSRVEIGTTLGELPAPRFDWLAIAQDAMSDGSLVLTRLPASPVIAHFATHELAVH